MAAQCIDPSLILRQTSPSRSRTPAPRSHTPFSSTWNPNASAHRGHAHSASILSLPPARLTPSALLDGSYHSGTIQLECLPLSPEIVGPPTLVKQFSANGGQPAPYLYDLLRGKVALDNGERLIFADQGWTRTCWKLDWPGYGLESQAHALNATQLTTGVMALEIAASVKDFLGNKMQEELTRGPSYARWSASNVRFKDVRLLAIHYYRIPKRGSSGNLWMWVWVPVLAVNAG
ncbi:hypothetical protein MIND_00012900 [Mycena indigotica]|uniref:Uncharacterized protein n=1 Tax=Mycena indigotica TaxID=2126181 RepID=A0A8H6WHE4_9AGAR|nr:uncharacterized protein MIND_00012900 [Mycena indigotica]KAF7314988.1 hypothetical protein MIND_00012900 [Mycena indigotica]